MVTVELRPEALEQAERLPVPIRDRLRRIILRLKQWPAVSGAKPLTGGLSGWYRLRTGDYRIRFFLKGDRLVVDKIGHRSKFYED